MRYDPTGVTEGGGWTPVDPGDYPFTVTQAVEKTSKNGNEMIEVKLAFDVGRGQDLNVTDRLVNTANALWKVKQFCKAVGVDFDAGELDATSLEGCQGIATLILGEANDKGKRYMEVEAYVQPKAPTYSEQPKPAAKPTPRATGNAMADRAAQQRQARGVQPTQQPEGSDDIPF